MKIQTLDLFTPNLATQTTFYCIVLDLEIIEQTNNSVAFQIGHSTLKLIYREAHTPYHFAFNIPTNQEKEALQWLKERVDIIQYENTDIQYFDFWDAHAIYFYDEDGKIAGLIARKTLPFSDILP